jgi:hypothetical protein
MFTVTRKKYENVMKQRWKRLGEKGGDQDGVIKFIPE